MTENPGLSRRAILLGGAVSAFGVAGAGFAGIEAGVLPGRSRLRRVLGQDGPDGVLPDVAPGYRESGSLLSQRRQGRRCGWTIAYPGAVAEPLPVVVVLHGKGSDHTYAFGDELGLDRFLVAGRHRFALASIDGGDGYWHRRDTGEDAGAMVVEEFVPLLTERGLQTLRIGLFGWSMGGFGALWLAGRLGHDRVAAVAIESPAIWHHASQTAPGAFDNAADFAAHDVFSHPDWDEGVPLRIDCGTDDGFYPAARDYAAQRNPRPAGQFAPGGHQVGYWRRMAPAQLAFLAQHVT